MTTFTEEEMDVFLSHVATIGDANINNDRKLQAAHEIADNLDMITASPSFQSFLDSMLHVFIKVATEGKVHFIAENSTYQLRKKLLEIIHRIPAMNNDVLKAYADTLISMCLKCILYDNEEIMIVSMFIFVEIIKAFRPPYSEAISSFLEFAKKVFRELPAMVDKMFEIRDPITANNLESIDWDSMYADTFSPTPLNYQQDVDGNGKPVIRQLACNKVASMLYYLTAILILMRDNLVKLSLNFQCNILPKSWNSVKAMQDLPIYVAMMYGVYKDDVNNDMIEYIPLAVATLPLQPSQQDRDEKKFNKDLYADFMMAKIRVISFLAHISKPFNDILIAYGSELVEGIMSVLRNCPKETAYIRREFFTSIRAILKTDLKLMFVPFIDELCDEDVLLNRGWTTLECVRPFAYGTLADFIYHVRHHLPLETLIIIVKMFALNSHDDRVSMAVHSLCTRVLTNISDCVKNKCERDYQGDDEHSQISAADRCHRILFVITRECTLKVKEIATKIVPYLNEKQKLAQQENTIRQKESSEKNNTSLSNNGEKTDAEKLSTSNKEKEKSGKTAFYSIVPTVNYNAIEAKALLRSLISAVKSATLTSISCMEMRDIVFYSAEIIVYGRFVKWCLQAFDLYLLNAANTSNSQAGRTVLFSKEDVQVLDHFITIFTPLHPRSFREVIAPNIHILVERTFGNPGLLYITESFLSNNETKLVFGGILKEYLKSKLDTMGSSDEQRNNLYLKLYKCLFDNVVGCQFKDEHILCSDLHLLVYSSMENATVARDPHRYFQILRSLFRAIGAGCDPDLYTNFLPLLPRLLKSLNRLQFGAHKPATRELFVELSLTVPVRLSSLLPYLPLIMDPLVSALNGSPSLVGQGMGTLELCVDNLQPDFFYKHIDPVHGDITRALWKAVNSPLDPIALPAYRILGKFGGHNRSTLYQPRELIYRDITHCAPTVEMYFTNYRKPVFISAKMIVETAVMVMRSTASDYFYRFRAWQIIKSYICSSMDIEYPNAYKYLLESNFKKEPNRGMDNLYICENEMARNTLISALTGLFIASATNDLKKIALPTMVGIVRHFTILAVIQQMDGEQKLTHQRLKKSMDPLVLIDSVAYVMGHEEKELSKPGRLALAIILNTASSILHCKTRACKLPMMNYIAKHMIELCYARAWYTKQGGCDAIRFMYTKFDTRWVYEHLRDFEKALMFVVMDLCEDLSYGIVQLATEYLEEMIRRCVIFNPGLDEETKSLRENKLNSVIRDLCLQINSSNKNVRVVATQLLRIVAHASDVTISEVLVHQLSSIARIIPTNLASLDKYNVNFQIGIMEGYTFVASLVPRIYSLDTNLPQHVNFYRSLLTLCALSNEELKQLECYNSILDFQPLKLAATKALAATQLVPALHVQIFKHLFQMMDETDVVSYEMAFSHLKSFVEGTEINFLAIGEIAAPLLELLTSDNLLGLCTVRKLNCLIRLFPADFNNEICDILIVMIIGRNLIALSDERSHHLLPEANLKEMVEIINLALLTMASIPLPSCMETLCHTVLQSRYTNSFGAISPFHRFLAEFLRQIPMETVTFFTNETSMGNQLFCRYFRYLLKLESCEQILDILKSDEYSNQICLIMENCIKTFNQGSNDLNITRYNCVRLMALLVKLDPEWVCSQRLLSLCFTIWKNTRFHENSADLVETHHSLWNEPKHLAKVILRYFTRFNTRMDLLFYLTRAFAIKSTNDFQFLKEFLEKTVTREYPAHWKRDAFLRYCEVYFYDKSILEEIKIKVVTHILIPGFVNSFEKGEAEKLLLPSANGGGNAKNLADIFLTRIVLGGKGEDRNDAMRMCLQQMSLILVEHAFEYFGKSNAGAVADRSKLRSLVSYVWDGLSDKKSADGIVDFHGRLLLCHIISKMVINPEILTKVYRSLLRAHGVEVRVVVIQALDILTPLIPLRLNDGYHILRDMTRNVLADKSYNIQHVVHVLQIIVRHYRFYFPIRHKLFHHLIQAIDKLSRGSSPDHKKLSIDLCEIVIKWELHRLVRKAELSETDGDEGEIAKVNTWKTMLGSSNVSDVPPYPENEECMKPFEQAHTDIVVSLLAKMACATQLMAEFSPSMIETLCKRCTTLLRSSLVYGVFPANTAYKRLGLLGKILSTPCNLAANIQAQSNVLEVITVFARALKPEENLELCYTFQSGIITCITSRNPKLLRFIQNLMTYLMEMFPPNTLETLPAANTMSVIYASIDAVITEGFANFEVQPMTYAAGLLSALIVLKAAYAADKSYLDVYADKVVRIMRILVDDMRSNNTCDVSTVDCIVNCFEMLKNRIILLSAESEKIFVNCVVAPLLENCNEVKLIKFVCKMMEDWIANGHKEDYGGPSAEEKSNLLRRTLPCLETKLIDLCNSFMDAIFDIYRTTRPIEITHCLELVCLTGLRSSNPHIRSRYFEVLNEELRKVLLCRLLFVTSTQDWLQMGNFYWIKQALHLLLMTCVPDNPIALSRKSPVLLSVSSTLFMMNIKPDKYEYSGGVRIKDEPVDVDASTDELDAESIYADHDTSNTSNTQGGESVYELIERQIKFLNSLHSGNATDFADAVSQMCYLHRELAESVWKDVFPQFWTILETIELKELICEIPLFVASGSHLPSVNASPSALATFVEALYLCNPPVVLRPRVLHHLAKTHNLWHCCLLQLEALHERDPEDIKMIFSSHPYSCDKRFEYVKYALERQEIFDSLCDLYLELYEMDLWSSMWETHAKYAETKLAVMYEQQGRYEQALGAYELAISKAMLNYSDESAPSDLASEMILWDKGWVNCTKELNQWEKLHRYAQFEPDRDHHLTLESLWRKQDWDAVEKRLNDVGYNTEVISPLGKGYIFKGYLMVANKNVDPNTLVKFIEEASVANIKRWQSLPRVTSHSHIPSLQIAQQIIELKEGYNLRQTVKYRGNGNSVFDLQSPLNTWKVRLAVIGDNLTYWDELLEWRNQNYKFVTDHFQNLGENPKGSIHCLTRSMVQFGCVARKQGLTSVSLTSLNKLFAVPTVPPVDCFEKVRQQVKCHLLLSEVSSSDAELKEGLDAIDYTITTSMSEEMKAELLAMKGLLLHRSESFEEANNCFMTAVQLNDTLYKGWAYWGAQLEEQFVNSEPRNYHHGKTSVICYVNACFRQGESKSQKYLSKVLWLLNYDNEEGVLAKTTDDYSRDLSLNIWLPLIPQLVSCLLRPEGRFIKNLLVRIGLKYPQAVFYPINTLYTSHKIELYEKLKGPNCRPADTRKIKASSAMVHCASICLTLEESNPNIFNVLQKVSDELLTLQIDWSERVLNQLRLVLRECYSYAFNCRERIHNANITRSMLADLKNICCNFGQLSAAIRPDKYINASNPVYVSAKEAFVKDFNFDLPGSVSLLTNITKIKKWIKSLTSVVRKLPKFLLITEKSKYLNEFGMDVAEIEIPGAHLTPKYEHYSVFIDKFLPKVSVVDKHNSCARKLYIRGNNGNIYTYLITQEEGSFDTRREEIVSQLFGILNSYFLKRKETATRFIRINLPKILSLSSKLRLVEDWNSLSYSDIIREMSEKVYGNMSGIIDEYYELDNFGDEALLHFYKTQLSKSAPPSNTLKLWAAKTYCTTTDFWSFRKGFTNQLATLSAMEYIFSLTKLDPDMMYIRRDSGVINAFYYKFDVESVRSELPDKCIVPFRLANNLKEFITSLGISGPFTAAILAIARCLAYSNFMVDSVMRPLIRDEVIISTAQLRGWEIENEDMSAEDIITSVNMVVDVTMKKINSLTSYDDLTENKIANLVISALNEENLCQMNPMWHPWL